MHTLQTDRSVARPDTPAGFKNPKFVLSSCRADSQQDTFSDHNTMKKKTSSFFPVKLKVEAERFLLLSYFSLVL